MMLRFAAVLALVCSSCAWPKSITFVWQGAPEDLPAARAAADEWNVCPGVRLEVVEHGNGVPIVAVDTITSDPPGQKGHTHTVDNAPEWIEYVPTTFTQSVLAHEMGHALGLHHNDDPADLMYVHMQPGTVVRRGDCEALP